MRLSWISIFLLFIFTSCSSQENLLLEKKAVVNLNNEPFYRDMTEEVNGSVIWKKEFEYINDIDIFDITYKSDGLKIKGFLVTPKKEGNYPVIIFNRGGSFDFGALDLSLVSYWMGKLAAQGYVVIGSQYRGNAGSEGKEEFGGDDVNDVLNLIPLIDELAYADSNRIGMYGWSRGGMMTYLALPKSNRIKAAIVGGAVADFRLLEADRPGFIDYIPDTENIEEALDQRSPVLWANKFSKTTPILLLHGNSDWRVKSEHSLKMALEFEKYRIPYRLIIYEGGNHGIFEHRIEVDQEIMNWFNKYLKQDTPLPNMEYHGR
jgi:dipeptidyl aminopeptidase/acylaminoacyl peptidase